MAALSVSAVRQRVQLTIASALSGDGWRPSRFVPELFARDSDQISPRMYSVGVQSTRPIGDRQRATVGTVVETMVVVRFAWRLRADAQVADYDAALDAEAEVLEAVMATPLTDLHIRLDTIPQRRVFTDGAWFLGELLFRAEHRLALS